jgi:two-component system, NtrC family, sensor histidine kinase PilS
LHGERPVGVSASPLRNSDGGLRGFIVLVSDLSRQKEAQRREREREGQAAIGRLSREIAHEIRNPLATVRGCVEVIKLSHSENPATDPYLDLALKESDRLNNLLRDFLVFAHLSTPKKAAGDLAALIRSRIKNLHGNIEVHDLLPERCDAKYDSDQITLVVDAMLLALAEWAEEHDEIRIESAAEPHAGLRFVLSGTTLSADLQEGAFQPFCEAQQAINRLALPTAMRAVQAHGGTLLLKSDPSIGTWFELAL